MPTKKSQVPNLYHLPFGQQAALFLAKRNPINDETNGMCLDILDELREAQMIDDKGSLTPRGEKVLKSSPEVGMGVTECLVNDRYAWTVSEVLSRARVRVQKDTARRVDKNGLSEHQRWEHTPNPEGETKVISLRQDGSWREQGKQASGNRFQIGERHTYMSPSI